MVEITWDGNIETENKKEIEKHLNSFLWLIPAWIQTFNVFVYTTSENEFAASMSVKERYREATMNVYAMWFICSEQEKLQTIVHELCHLYTNPLYDFSLNAIRKYAKDSDSELKDILFDEMECYLERQTQDLSYAIVNKFK